MKAQHMNRHITSCLRLLTLAAALCFVMAGCGGSGEGDSKPHLTYAGLTTPALITEDNAELLAHSALNAGASSNSFANIDALEEAAPVAVDSNQGFLSDLVMGLDRGLGKIDFLKAPVQDLSASVVSGTGSIDHTDTGGGSASYTIQLNTNTGTFNGSMTFSSYCEAGMTINGSSGFYGVVNMMTEELDSFTLNFDYLTATDGSDAMAMDGEIYMVVSGSTIMATLDMMIQENGSDRVYKIENYQMDITEGYPLTNISINGRLYDPDYGYVDIETTTSFQVYDVEDYPDYGVMLLTGENGSAGGATWARLNALSSTKCQVIADTVGDGNYDYDTGPMDWSEL